MGLLRMVLVPFRFSVGWSAAGRPPGCRLSAPIAYASFQYYVFFEQELPEFFESLPRRFFGSSCGWGVRSVMLPGESQRPPT